MTGDTQSTAASTLQSRRQLGLAVVLGVVVIAGIAWAAWWLWSDRYDETTDDAYVSGNVVQITPQISGTVVAIGADDTQFVKAGALLVQLDRADAKVALDRAEAQLAKTVRDVRAMFATSAKLKATVEMRRSDLNRAQDDLARRQRLAGSGAISNEDLKHAQGAVDTAKAALLAAEEELAANQAHIDRTTVDDNPDVRNAATRVREAYLSYARTELPAPVSGFVAKRAVQLGQRVAPGVPLMAIVPLDQVWVDANFKESQLAHMRVGQRVSLTADLYGGKVDYRGKVVGFGAGTGSAFALLPAQNATGNWIKIVQRVPVRIALDPKDLAAHPLQIGLSMQVDVDTHDRSGVRLPEIARTGIPYATDVFHSQEAVADERVRAIIAANEAGAPATQAAASLKHARPSRAARSHSAKNIAAARSKPL
jgi:membrane fusion protein, multidrug efflux system